MEFVPSQELSYSFMDLISNWKLIKVIIYLRKITILENTKILF